MEAIRNTDNVTITFSIEESLVLLDWLAFLNTIEDRTKLFQDQAEERILWDLEGVLEKTSTEVFYPDFKERLTAARNKIRDIVA